MYFFRAFGEPNCHGQGVYLRSLPIYSGASLRASLAASRCGRDSMKTRQRMAVAVVVGFSVVLPAAAVRAENPAGTPSQADIERGLKTRGLPTLGTSPAPAPGPS